MSTRGIRAQLLQTEEEWATGGPCHLNAHDAGSGRP